MGAHPRACGENTWVSHMVTSLAGSSPRMRGKHNAALRALATPGLIPAHAGKTVCSAFWQVSSKAHPRACGENSLAG